MKRFHDLLADAADSETADDATRKTIYRDALQCAYADYAGGTQAAHQVFPGLLRATGNFIALSSVRRRDA